MSDVNIAVNSIRAILANAKDIWEILNRVSGDPKVILSDTDISILSRRFVFQEDIVFDSHQVGREFLEGDAWVFDQTSKQICAPRCGYISWKEKIGYVVASPIVVSQDSMSAYLVVPPKRMLVRPITVSILRDMYLYSGLKREYDGAIESFLLSCWGKGGVFKISEGTSPTTARKRKFSFALSGINLEKESHFGLHKSSIIEVQEGEKLASITPEKEYQEGVDVFGNLLTPDSPDSMNNQEEYQVGFGCHISKDGMSLIASVTGIFIADKEKREYSIKDTLYLEEDLVASYGNIQTKYSNIHIKGSVQGITIKSGGDLIIQGQAEDVHLNSGGKIVVKQGIRGANKISKIDSASIVEALFLSKVLVRAGSNVCVDSYIVDSEISSEGSIVVLDKDGEILHSRLSASGWVACQHIGSDEEKKSKNVFRIGFNAEEHGVRMRIDDHMQKLQEEIQKLRGELGEAFLKNPAKVVKTISVEHHGVLRQRLGDLKKFGTKLLQLQRYQETMNQKDFHWDEKKSGVAVFAKISSEVSIYLEKYGPLVLQEDVSGPIYFKINLGTGDKIVSTALTFFSSPADILSMQQ